MKTYLDMEDLHDNSNDEEPRGPDEADNEHGKADVSGLIVVTEVKSVITHGLVNPLKAHLLTFLVMYP